MTPDSSKKDQILIVDDSTSMLAFFKETLHKDYRLVLANSGEKALRLIKGPVKPDIILLDITMTGMDGFEVCQKLKKNKDTKNIPVIFITGTSSHKEETKGFEVGCVDFIPKPPNPITVKARVETHLKLAKSNALLIKQNTGLQLDMSTILKAQEVMDFERETVEAILDKMRQSSSFNNTNIRFIEQPLESSTGDILLACNRPSGVRHILLGDFTGHGLSAALAGPMASDIFYQMTLKGCSSDQILIELNTKLLSKLPLNMYMAGAFIEINPQTKSCSIWNGGLPNLLVFYNNKLVQEIESAHPPLGIIGGESFNSTGMPLMGEKTHIFAYSDGITEIINQSGEMFGCERLILAIESMLNNKLPLDYLLNQAKEFQGQNEGTLSDDVTLVEVIC